MTARFFHLMFACIACLAPIGASAQEPASDDLEEVIVTARFRDTALLKSSGSISVIRQSTVFDRGAQHLEETLNVLPNVNFSSGASRARFVQVRGVGDLEQFVDPKYFPSVGVTIDDVDMNGLAAAAIMLDIQQVEVLRGPQGTRFGTNALAGMVNIRSNDPTATASGYAQVGLSRFDGWNVAAALSGPLGSTVLGRIAVRQNKSDGFIHNDYLARDDTNDRDELSLRGKLRWLGSGDSYTDLTLFYVNIDNGYDAFSLDNSRHTLSDQPGQDEQESISIALKSYWHFNSHAALETILTYADADTLYSYDEDWSNPDICSGLDFCYPYNNTDEQDRTRENLSLDSHLMSVDIRRWNWVAGVYAQRRQEDFQRQYYGPFESHYETRRYAAYTQMEYALGDDWRVRGGLRFEKFEDDYHDSNALVSATSDHYFTGEITIQHDLNDTTGVYGTLSRGVKPGGVNTEASSVFDFLDARFQDFMRGRLRFGSESLLNKEVGIKGRFLGDALSLRAALFHMDRRAAQLEAWIWDDVNFLWVGYLDSVGRGSNYGAELELDYRVSPGLDLFAGLGWLNTNIDAISVVDLGEPGRPSQSVIRLKKNRDQTKAPRWQYNLGGSVALTPRLTARLEVEGRSASFYGYYHDQKIAAYTLLNASLGYRFGSFTIHAWGRNLSNRDYAVHGLYFGNDPRNGYLNTSYRQFGEPQVYGVDVEYRFF